MLNKYNWRIRFNKDNIQFLFRFVAALLVPILAYFGLNFEDMTTWNSVWLLLKDFVSNPFLVGLTIYNAINMIPDPTQAHLGDSEMAMNYKTPKK